MPLSNSDIESQGGIGESSQGDSRPMKAWLGEYASSPSAQSECDIQKIEVDGSTYYAVRRSLSLSKDETATIAVSFPKNSPTASQMDMLESLVKQFQHELKREAVSAAASEEDMSTIFLHLLNGQFVNHLWLESFNAYYHISSKPILRLLHADVTALEESKLEEFKSTVAEAFDTFVCGEMMDGRYVFMLKSDASDYALSNEALLSVMDSEIFPRFGVRIASSQVYDNLLDTYYAQKQIKLVIKYAPFVDISNKMVVSDVSHPRYYPFEDCVIYALLIEDMPIDADFRDFCFAHTPVARLFNEDLENDTNYVRILIMYLYYGHRASVVADKLHMHRNTVLYHINKIQKRFGIDLEDARLQQRIMLDADVLFKRMAYSPQDFDHLLNPYKKEK